MRLTTERTRSAIGFDDTWFLIIGIPLIAFILPLLFFGATLSDGLLAYLPKFGVSITYTIVYWFTMRMIFIRLRLRFPSYTDTTKRTLYIIVLGLAAYAFLNFAMDLTIHDYLMPPEERELVPHRVYSAVSLTILIMVSALYESIYMYQRWKESIIEKEKLERVHFQSQLEGLRNQVNPHFLFNSLNTLAYIIPEDPEKAVKFVQKLSKVYRYVLEIRDKKLIPVSEELNFLQSYLFLLKERFGENLKVEIDIPTYLHQESIVPLSLQLLFENAIKHNIISSTKPLTVELFTENDDLLIVRNNLQLKQQTHPSTKVGLENIKNRFAFFSDRKVDIEQTEAYFIVRLPLIKTKVSVV